MRAILLCEERKDTILASEMSKGENIENEAREIVEIRDHYSVWHWKVLEDFLQKNFLSGLYKSLWPLCEEHTVGAGEVAVMK